jgi:hypothetical protein
MAGALPGPRNPQPDCYQAQALGTGSLWSDQILDQTDGVMLGPPAALWDPASRLPGPDMVPVWYRHTHCGMPPGLCLVTTEWLCEPDMALSGHHRVVV